MKAVIHPFRRHKLTPLPAIGVSGFPDPRQLYSASLFFPEAGARGYSLIELLLVCGLMGILAGLGFSSFRDLTEEHDLLLAADSFLSSASTARFLSVARNLPLQMVVHPDRLRFGMAPKGDRPPTWQPLPGTTRFLSVPSRLPTFHSRGFAAPAGSFLLGNEKGQIRVVISPTGRIRRERIH